MARVPTLLLAVLVIFASAQCFGKCLGDSCKGAPSARCHPHQKTASHCSNDVFIADESSAATQHPDIAVSPIGVSLAVEPEFSSRSITVARFTSPPLLVRSITILKI
jgi:hypothetical protein